MVKKTRPQGGYMRSLHKLEEKLYAPDLNVSGLSELKVLLYIRHNSVRWDKEDFEFSYSEMAKGIGIAERSIKRVIKSLTKKKLLLIMKSSQNGNHFRNVIGLNPEYFGDLIELTGKPKLSVIRGGQDEKLSTVVTSRSPGVVTSRSLPWCHPGHPEHTQEALQKPKPRPLKNSSKEQYKKLLRGKVDTFGKDGNETEDRDPRLLAVMQRFKDMPRCGN